MTDTRIAYGARCFWWDSIHEVGHLETRNGATLPCCPHCSSVLFEVPDEETWFDAADRHEASGHPGYRAMIEWSRGKCFPSLEAAQKAYAEREQTP
jgi:hypothetical protein